MTNPALLGLPSTKHGSKSHTGNENHQDNKNKKNNDKTQKKKQQEEEEENMYRFNQPDDSSNDEG